MHHPKRHYVTYFDRNYLAKGVAMIRSLAKHERADYELFVVCMDELTRAMLTKLDLPNVELVALHDIEWRDDALVAARADRSLVEYYWTLTPTIVLRMLEWHRDIEVITYLDADLFFFSSPDPIFEELGEDAVLIHEHRFSPDLADLAENGRFNVGLMCFRNDERGLDALRWWRARCNEWCFKRVEDGKMGDQLYLEDWPTRFAGVRVLEHVGAGLAPWNHIQYPLSEGPAVADRPVVFYHFHALAMVSPEVAIPVSIARYRLREDIVRELFVPYVEAVARAYDEARVHAPSFRSGLAGAQALNASCVFIALRTVAEVLDHAGLPHARRSLDEGWDLYAAPQLVAAPAPATASRVAAARATADATASPVIETRVESTPPRAARGGPIDVTVVVAIPPEGCPCGLRHLLPAMADRELVVACGSDTVDDVLALTAPFANRRVVVHDGSAPAALNLALGLSRGGVIVIAEPQSCRAPWIAELVTRASEASALRARHGMVLTRSTLERFGGIAPDFEALAAGLDDWCLRIHAGGGSVQLEDAERVYPPADWRRWAARWGFSAELGQTGVLPGTLAPQPATLQRIALGDVAASHEVTSDGRLWRSRASAVAPARVAPSVVAPSAVAASEVAASVGTASEIAASEIAASAFEIAASAFEIAASASEIAASEIAPSAVTVPAEAPPRQPALPSAPRPTAAGEEELLHRLHGLPICDTIRSLHVIGAHLFQEGPLLVKLFPGLTDLVLFEPQPAIYQQLRRLTVSGGRLDVFPYAIADFDGPASFHVTNNVASSSLLELGAHREIFPHVKTVGDIEVECRRLDTVVASHGVRPPDCLFIDVQGAEYQVLSALSEDLLAGVRLIYTEASLDEVYRGARPLDALRELLEPRFTFLGFHPLAAHCPTHGNALFVRTSDRGLLELDANRRVA